MAPRPTGITRRGLMGAMGGALAGGAFVAGEAGAVSEPLDANGVPLKGVVDVPVTAGAPTIAPQYSYTAFGQFAFRANNPLFAGYQGPYYFSAPGAWAAGSLDLPAGSRLRQVTVCAANGTGSNASFTISQHQVHLGSSTDVVSVTVPAGASQYTPITIDCDVTLEPASTYSMFLNCSNETVGIASVLIACDNTATYVPVTPYRCYDSRFGFAGKLAPNTSRILDVTTSIDPATGYLVDIEMIPSTARAVTFNLQAVQATGANNFAITNGDALSANASHIVFNSNTPTVANAGTVDIADGTVKVFGGGGPGAAHCILDITGYYV